MPPPDPKRFTDEELKQRYGIHLATRLQSDDPGRQANWADIDDDDDDWAPETIEWTDGTKITLPQADETPMHAPVPLPVPAVRDGNALEAIKPKSPALSQASASPTVKPSTFGGRTGLVLKGASEKPTLVAKPPGPPTPVKSPWAPLPPMEKVAPIAIDVPPNQQQQQQSRFGQRDPHGFQAMPPPPAKEIAADDFSRSWREGHPNTGRELYNSQSGRYEPVNDNRRGSRNDIHSRQPAVLQRPSQQDGPAEPSAAFQTHRASGADGGYGRRRTSSNVSGGSGNFIRRMSRGDMPPPLEMLNARRGSLAAVSDEPSSPRNFSPSGQHQSQRGNQNQTWSRASPVISHPSPQSAHGQMAQTGSQPQHAQPAQASQPVVQEDPIEEQKKIMRLRREQAIKRRQEEEAKEEAAKKERIRLKLEAMEKEHGRLPEAKKKDVPKEEKAIPTQIQTREATQPAQPERKSNIESNAQVSRPADPSAPSVSEDARVAGAQELHPNGIHSGPSSTAPVSLQQGNRPVQSWQSQPTTESDRFHSWAPPPAQQSGARSVWGPPSNDRTLGNGTFNPELSAASSSPGAIGPPSRANAPYQQGRGREFTARPAPIGPPNRTNVPSKDQQTRVAASGWSSLPEKLAQEDALLTQQQAAELTHRRDLQAKGLYMEPPQPILKDHWRQVTINEDGTRGPAQPVSLNIIEDGQKQDEGASRQIYEESRQLDRQPQFSNDPWRSTPVGSSPQVRGSRFFPNNNHRDIRLDDPNAFLERPGSPSPPPPTMADHPAYDGDIAHPQVSLPRPSPVVKLPPAVLAPIGPPKPSSFAAAATSPAAAPAANHRSARQDYNSRQTNNQEVPHQLPPVGSGGWQDRISNLLGRKSSPPKSQALAVDSSSKNALELPTSQSFATVSLPSSVSGDLAPDDGSVASKPAAEECFEEQEMGSLPVIKVPFAAPAAAWSLAPAAQPLPPWFALSDTTTIEPISFNPHNTNNSVAVTILLPGQKESKSVNLPTTTRHRNSPRRGGGSRGASRHSGPHSRGGRARDTTSRPPNAGSENTSSPTSRGGHRGNSRGHGSNWNRHSSAPVQT